jgi:YVTN family beta-propeller protein
MRRFTVSSLLSLALLSLALLSLDEGLVGCGGSPLSVTCGPGTARDGGVCLPTPADAFPMDGSAPSDAAPAQGDAADAATDAAPPDSSVADAPGEGVEVGPADAPGEPGPEVGAADAPGDAPADGGQAKDAGTDAKGLDDNCASAPDIASPGLITLGGGLRELRIDACHAHVYVSNDTGNRIEDVSVAAGAVEAPIPVGSSPEGFDITPDGARLYVANRGGTNVSVVDLATRQELKKISFTSGFSGDTPLSLAIAKNGKAFFSTTFAGSGFGGRVMSLDLATEAVTQEDSFFVDGTTTEATILQSSFDHTVIGAVAGDISSAPVFVYTAAADTFKPEHDLNRFVSRVVVSADGSLLLVDGAFVLDTNLNLLGTISGATTVWAAFGPSSGVAYRAAGDHIDVLDTTHFLVTGSIPVTADTMHGTDGSRNLGNLGVSSNGHWIVIITDHGLTFVNAR